MNYIALLDGIYFFASLSTLVILLFKSMSKAGWDIRLLFGGILILSALYSSCLFAEWGNISNSLDSYEDLLGALIPMMWAFLFYAFVQKIINKELKLAKEKAEESDRLKSSFLANISHEIRTPMNGILGFADLLKNPKLDSNKQQEFITIIEKSGKRMLNIINDIVDISKIEAGRVTIKKEKIIIEELFEDLYIFFEPDAAARKLSLSYSLTLPEENFTISSDKTKLNQILSNLIKNALKYTNEGGVKFACSTDQDSITFFVSDTGIGIPPALHDRIFERFRQADLSTTKAEEGSGLGLTIAKSYAELLSGEIILESTPGKGSVFSVKLPVEIPHADNEIRHIKTDIESGKFKDITILVAEDDDNSYLFLSHLLSLNKVKVIRAKNGKEAVDMCKKNPDIKLVLMDIKMPVLDGYEAIKQIKEFWPDLPIIAQTAYAMTEDKDKALNLGSDAYLSKPIRSEELISIINQFGVGKN